MPPAARPSPPAPPFRCAPRMLRVAVSARQHALGLAEQDIARQTDLPAAALAPVLAGAVPPDDRTVNRLVHWLGLPLAWFNQDQAEAPAPLLRVAVSARQQALGLSQQDIARQAGLSEPRLSRFLGPAREDPSAETAGRLVRWLGLPPGWFGQDQAEVPDPARAVPAA